MVPAGAVGAVPEARSWLEIDLGAIVANAKALAKRVSPASLCAVVKANGYGHGLVPVARALADANIPGLHFGVFSVTEGVALFDNDISDVDAPAIVLGPVEDDALSDAVDLHLELALLDERSCEAFARHGVRAHLKIDTGLNRFGLAPEQAPAALRRCRERGVNLAGIYSHLANAEDLDREFTMQQVQRLRDAAIESTRSPTGRAPALHIASSAAAMMWPETRLDMVRCGIALYGAWPSREVCAFMAGEAPSFELVPALRWFAPIVQVRDVRAGESVGYGRAFVADRDSRIALLPLGYADGLPRAAGMGKAQVRIGADAQRRVLAPIAGRICMNVSMLDVTDVAAHTAAGDIVELEVDDVARAAGTINYEVLAALPTHLERRYRASK